MTEVKIEHGTNTVRIKATGHCTHDVCVSVSALTSALLQYSHMFCEECPGCSLDKVKYEPGEVDFTVSFDGRERRERYLEGAQSVFSGYELFAYHFPKDVDVTVIRNVTPFSESM